MRIATHNTARDMTHVIRTSASPADTLHLASVELHLGKRSNNTPYALKGCSYISKKTRNKYKRTHAPPQKYHHTLPMYQFWNRNLTTYAYYTKWTLTSKLQHKTLHTNKCQTKWWQSTLPCHYLSIAFPKIKGHHYISRNQGIKQTMPNILPLAPISSRDKFNYIKPCILPFTMLQ